jgi:hypothetical protein
MTIDEKPVQPKNSFRVKIELNSRVARMDTTLLAALKNQSESVKLKNISRQAFKSLFLDGKVQIKGQRAKPSSALSQGITYVDILS